jgi:SPP1 family predicted phage head-tail adaptor
LPGLQREVVFPPKTRQITVEAYTTAQDSAGEPIKTWAPRFTNIYAAVEFLSGSEVFAASKINTRATVRFGVNYRCEITTKMRVAFKCDNWNIVEVRPVNDFSEMWLYCTRVE